MADGDAEVRFCGGGAAWLLIGVAARGLGRPAARSRAGARTGDLKNITPRGARNRTPAMSARSKREVEWDLAKGVICAW